VPRPVVDVGSPDLVGNRAFFIGVKKLRERKKMKVCERCATEISTPHGVNRCHKCRGESSSLADLLADPRIEFSETIDLQSKNEDAYEKLGLTKVVKPCGGVYWE